MNNNYQDLISSFGKNRFLTNHNLAEHTTYKIGGPADLFFQAQSELELEKVVLLADKLKINYFILGAGSNILISDLGFRGLVIHLQFGEIKFFPAENNKAKVLAESGAMLQKLLNLAEENSLGGIEFLAGIPGTLGGAIRGNAGAWREQIGDFVLRVKILSNGKIYWIEKKDCSFSYRESRFKHNREIILAAELILPLTESNEIRKKTIENLKKRENQPSQPSAGCIFVNPKPFSAGELIDKCGLKGEKQNQAQISPLHANFIVNLGGAKAVDVESLILKAKNTVLDKFKIDIKEEVVKVGDF